MFKFILPGAVVVLLALTSCTEAHDPGYICMTNCAHECGDGMQGDSCRAMKQQQEKDRDQQEQDYNQ